MIYVLVCVYCVNGARGFLSGFWQAFAWTFGASLKKKYKPDSTDRLTERVVLMVEAGQL